MGVSIFNTGYDLQDQIDAAESAIAIVSIGDTHVAITSGQYVYVREHGTLAEGLYRATANIAANATLSGSNVTAVSGGGLNALNSNIAKKQDVDLATGVAIQRCGNVRIIKCTNSSGEIPAEGIALGEAVSENIYAPARYFDGTSNKDGWINVSYGRLYLRNAHTQIISGTYVTGQIVFFV